MKRETIRHQFVEFIPDVIEDGVLYVSVEYTTVTHKCCCGCGREVVTPLSPTDWRLIFDGKTISLEPSVGNWQLPCQSHYWIRNDRVRWAGKWTPEQIAAGRAHDAAAKREYFDVDGEEEPMPRSAETPPARSSRWRRMKAFFGIGKQDPR